RRTRTRTRTFRTRTPNPELRTPHPPRLLTPHLTRPLVVAQSEVDGMTQPGVRRPLGELDLRDQLGTDPVRALVGLRPLLERALLRLERLQELHHLCQLLLVEAGAGVAGIDQVGAFVDAEQQRAEVRARAARLGPAADDELLLANELQFPPVGRALAGLVERVRLLRDQALPAARHRLVVEGLSVAAHLLADAENRRRGPAEQLFERLPPLGQRPPAVVGGAVAEEVERDERDAPAGVGRFRIGTRAPGSRRRVASPSSEVDAALQVLEAGRVAVGVERDDLAVEDERLRAPARPRPQRRGNFGKLARLLVAEPRPQADVAFRSDLDDRADAVVLRFVDETGTVERRVDERREHRLQDVVHERGLGAWGSGLAALRVCSRSLLAPSPSPQPLHYAAVFARLRPVGRFAAPRVRARGFADALAPAAFAAPAPPCARLRRRRSMRSTTSACRGSAAGSSSTSLPFILPLMIRIRFSRYWSVYFDGSQSAARLLTSAFAMSSSGLRTPATPGKSNCFTSTSSSAKRITDSTIAFSITS